MELDFNKIYVIESLLDSETKTGTNLHNDVIRRKLWTLGGYQSELVLIDSKLELVNFFEKVKTEIKYNNIIPFFHFEIHGNPNGFVLKSGEGVNWLELHHRFIELNILVNIKIWISLATCFGAYIYSIIKPIDKAPFYGYIGAWTELNVYDLQASFESFFDILLDKFDLNKAMLGLNQDNLNLPVEYKLYEAKDVFKRIYEGYEKTQYEPQNFEIRLDNIVKQALADPQNKILNLPESFYRDNAKKVLIDDKDYYKRKYEDIFYMTDIYPDNIKRFKLR
jgi:hypothetical protein